MSTNKEIQAVRLKGPVRVTIPAKVAYDLGSFQESITKLVQRLGCELCFSGANCTFQIERDFVINEAVEIGSNVRVFSTDPDIDPARLGPGVTASLAPEVSYNIDRIQNAVAKIVDRLGHPQCVSGFDIAFRQEVDLVVVDENIEIQTFGKSFDRKF